jgi:hypothetical protein
MSSSEPITPVGVGAACKGDYTIPADAARGQWVRTHFFVEKEKGIC